MLFQTEQLPISSVRKNFVWFITSVFFAYQFIIRVFPNVVNLELREKFDTSAVGISQFFGVYYLGYTMVHIPVGLLMDKVGPKIIMPLGSFLVCIGLLPLLFSTSLFYACLGRILIGIGSSTGVLGVFKIVRTYYPNQKIPFLLGLSSTIGLMGATLGGRPFYYCVHFFGWTLTLKVLILISILLGIIMFFSIPSKSIVANKEPISRDLKIVFSHRKWIIIAFLGGLMIGPLEGFSDGWAMLFLESYYPLWNKEILVFLPSLILIGLGIGGPVMGYIAEKTKAYCKIFIYTSFLMGLAFVILLKFKVSLLTAAILLFIIGLSSSYQTVVLYYASVSVPEKIAGITMACVNMIMLTFGYLFHTALGILMDYNAVIENDKYIYAPLVFTKALSLLPLTLFIASIGFIIMERIDKKGIKN